MNYEVGQQVGDYEILEILGAGGMGRVYKVRNLISERVEAMKVLLANLGGEPELMNRFLREIRVVGALNHPNIAGLHTAQRADNQVLMLMEFIEGESLDRMMRRGPIRLPDAVRYAQQVLDALGYAHTKGVVHRDVKPPNIMITPKGDAVITDFGIAAAGQDRRLTQTGRTLGSLYYMSPEQVNSAPDLDGRADIYALGVTLYEIATGKRPFEGSSDFSILSAHLHQVPSPPMELAPSIPPMLSQIIMTAMAKDPAQRFQTAEAMRAALGHVYPSGAALGETVVIDTRQATAPVAPPSPAVKAPPSAPPVVAQPAPPPVVAMKHGSGRRLLWLLAGSAVTLAVLVVAAIQLPFFQRTAAGPQVEEQALPEPLPAAAARSPAAEQVTSAGTPAAAGEPAPVAARPKTADPPKPAPTTAAPAPAAAQPAMSQLQQRAEAPTQPAVTAQQPAAAGPPPPAAPAPNSAALAQQRERLVDVATRAGPVRRSLENLRRAQARSGLGLRRDFETAEQRLVYLLDEAEAALKSGDSAAAEKHLDAAELSLRFLEKNLGQ